MMTCVGGEPRVDAKSVHETLGESVSAMGGGDDGQMPEEYGLHVWVSTPDGPFGE